MTRGEHPPSQRQLRVGEQMRHLLAEHLIRGELRDPRLGGRHLTVAEVRVSRDLKSATVFSTGASPSVSFAVGTGRDVRPCRADRPAAAGCEADADGREGR